MNTIYFTKRFTSGLLTGLSVVTALNADLPTEELAKIIHKGVRGKDAITGSKWIVTDASFQNYKR